MNHLYDLDLIPVGSELLMRSVCVSVYVTKNLAWLSHPPLIPLPLLRATPDGLKNRAQSHLFTHHAHHHPSLTICTPQPPNAKSQAVAVGACRPVAAQSDGTPRPIFPYNPHPQPQSHPLPPPVLSAAPPADCYFSSALTLWSFSFALYLSPSSLVLWFHLLMQLWSSVFLGVSMKSHKVHLHTVDIFCRRWIGHYFIYFYLLTYLLW